MRLAKRSRLDPSGARDRSSEERPASPSVSSKNPTSAHSLASFLAGAPERTDVDFLPSYRS